ncbi:MAG: carbonic anhydrase [Phenylobacterium sp.]
MDTSHFQYAEVGQTRRDLSLSKRGLLIGAAAGLLPASFALASPHDAQASVTPAAAMARLVAGNKRFSSGHATHPDADAHRRQLIAAGQRPFATILSCADSRVPPELIFDQGLGDLFVVRIAGNVVDDDVLASIEYSVIHTGCTLVLVLGHARCGAVSATIDALAGHGSPEDANTKIGSLAALITPAVKAVPASARDPLDAAISINAQNSAAAILAGSPPLKTRADAGRLRIVAARYDLNDGRVTYI